MVYPNNSKLKSLPINLYDRTKDPVDNIQMFQSHMHYVDAHNFIMRSAFLTTFCLIARHWYVTLKPNSIGPFKDFSHEFISHFTSSHNPIRMAMNLLRM